MLDVHNLERRWLKYKIKIYFPYALATIFILLLLVLLPKFFYSDSSKSETKIQDHIPAPQTKKVPIPTSIANKDSLSTVLEPSMNFVQTLQTTLPTAEAPNESIKQTAKPILQTVPAPKVLNVPDSSTIKPPLKAPPSTFSTNPEKPLTLNHNNETKLDIDSVERRFKETSNPALGLFIARYYYDHGNYTDAYNFALKTNSINNKMDESWIIFAKSLVKLGKVDQAKKTLQVYIGESNSDGARALLDSIERGSFK